MGGIFRLIVKRRGADHRLGVTGLRTVKRTMMLDRVTQRRRSMRRAGARSPSLARHERRRIPLAVFLAAGALALVMAAVLQLWTARQHVLQGSRDLHAAAGVLRAPLSLRDAAVRRRVRASLVLAQLEFASARTELGPSAPLLDHLGWVPAVGGRLASASPAADAAYYSTGAALHLADGLSAVWPAAVDHTSGKPLLERLALALQQGHAEFGAAQQDANGAARALAVLPSQSGDRTLERESARLRRDLPLLQQASTWLGLAPALMGARQPSHYLFAWENPAELRATGGFLGASEFLTVSDGHIAGHFVGRAPPHEITSVLVPLPEALYTNETYWILCDSNWSPDFPLTARLERWFYGEDTGRWADGVIDFVDTATPDILRAVGPVYLPEYRRWVDAANVVALANHYVNGRYWGPLQHGALADTLRKQFFHDAMRAVLRRVQTMPLHRWPLLGASLDGAVTRGDIVLYHRRPAVEAAIKAMGADGRILHPAGDFLYIVDDNRSYSKLNPYVRESASYQVRIQPGGWLDATLTLRYHVNQSPASLEGFGPAYGQIGTKHDYQDFLRVYVPPGAVLRRTWGLDRWAPASAYGLTQLAGRLLVRQGHSLTVRIAYRLPPSVLAASNFTSYHLTIQRQPGANLTRLQVRVRAPGQRFQADLPLQRYTYLRLALRSAIPPTSVPLLARAPSSDPYVPFDYLRDPRHAL